MIFGKGAAQQPPRLLADLFPRSFNIQVGEEQALRNHTDDTEDMHLEAWTAQRLTIAENSGQPDDASIGGMIATLAERQVIAQSQGNLEAPKTADAQSVDELEAESVAFELECADILLEKREQDRANALAGVEQRAREAAAAGRSLQDKIAALAAQVSDARDRASRAEAASAEIRRALAQADDRARLAAEETAIVREEIIALREQLQAARTVSAHLVAALRSDQPAAPWPVVVRRRWWWGSGACCRVAGHSTASSYAPAKG